jgi:N-acetylglucosaminyldiphosphoundecaprenol N-acetyl-beta-D-mannosaminyltransferase
VAAQMKSNDLKDDLSRNVWCLMGLPIDAVSMDQALEIVNNAIAVEKKLFLTTPNLNFVVGCLSDPKFRDSVIRSDLVVADGMPLIWVARLLNIPIRERVSGSNMVERMFSRKGAPEKYKIFYFGGQDDVADQANRNTERLSNAAVGVGAIGPGFVSVEAMSTPEYIQKINTSGADVLVVALGAKKGQDWIVKNWTALNVPVVSHLGAVVNFVAGTVSRSPAWMQKTGLEWLWRIKEENALYRRYWSDGVQFLALLRKSIIPQMWGRKVLHDGEISVSLQNSSLYVKGPLSVNTVPGFVNQIIPLIAEVDLLEVNFSDCTGIDARGIGVLMMLHKHHPKLKITHAPRHVAQVFARNNAAYLVAQRRDLTP